MELGENPGHLLIGALHRGVGLAQGLHLVLCPSNAFRNIPPHLAELLCSLVDVGKGVTQILELIVEQIRLPHHARERAAYQAQLPQGVNLLFYQLLLAFFKAVGHIENRVEVPLLPGRIIFLMENTHGSPPYSKTTQVMD